MYARHSNRRGLSTLELVLALPILLLIMALTINFGTVACWKVRGLNMARNALWNSRWPRSGAANPRPDFWPPTAVTGVGGPVNVPALDDPRVIQPVSRGPLSAALVNANLLDPTRGLREGSAALTRGYAMLGRMGTYRLHAETVMLDDRWQYPQMGLSSTQQRRIPIIYALQKAPANLVTAYVRAVVAILRAPFRPALKPLDRDDEFIYYRALFGQGGGAPDFHPPLHRFCSLDRPLADDRVNDLIDRIQGKQDPPVESVAKRMTREFIGLYEWAIQQYKIRMNANPPPPPGQMATMQADIDQLQQKIDALNQFLQTL